MDCFQISHHTPLLWLPPSLPRSIVRTPLEGPIQKVKLSHLRSSLMPRTRELLQPGGRFRTESVSAEVLGCCTPSHKPSGQRQCVHLSPLSHHHLSLAHTPLSFSIFSITYCFHCGGTCLPWAAGAPGSVWVCPAP